MENFLLSEFVKLPLFNTDYYTNAVNDIKDWHCLIKSKTALGERGRDSAMTRRAKNLVYEKHDIVSLEELSFIRTIIIRRKCCLSRHAY